jgi:hypothetical protein
MLPAGPGKVNTDWPILLIGLLPIFKSPAQVRTSRAFDPQKRRRVMDEPLLLAIETPSISPRRPDNATTEEAWVQAVLQGESVPAVASLYHIADLQQWIDLSA